MEYDGKNPSPAWSVKDKRVSGILLHLTSLPGAYGIGALGQEARDFVDFLHEAEQNVWQMLPIHDTGGLASPYSAKSTFALNPLLADLDELVAQNLLQAEQIEELAKFGAEETAQEKVDFTHVLKQKCALVAEAGQNLARKADHPLQAAFASYCRQHGPVWLKEFALFEALKAENNHDLWIMWPDGLAERSPVALRQAKTRLKPAMAAIMASQFLLEWQWQNLAQYAHKNQIALLGDMAIFLAHDSADVWANQHLFKLDEHGLPAVMAGVPPDYFSETGQHWGNPIYDWDAHKHEGFSWWIGRFERLLSLVDGVRIDHFRGFSACWEIPADAEDARSGHWISAPGQELFSAVSAALGDKWLVAEDLGMIDQPVKDLIAFCGFPGMHVLQFGFDDGPHVHRIHPNDYDANSLCCTGTHDNNTLMGWLMSMPEHTRAALSQMIGPFDVEMEEMAWRVIGLALGSNANLVITPLQDLLLLGAQARMNVPGTIAGNWAWRYRSEHMTAHLIEQLRHLTRQTRRVLGA